MKMYLIGIPFAFIAAILASIANDIIDKKDTIKLNLETIMWCVIYGVLSWLGAGAVVIFSFVYALEYVISNSKFEITFKNPFK